MKRFLPRLLPDFSWGRLGLILLGSAIASFGLYNIHQPCGITEGGVLGSVLLLHHWLGLPASIVTPVLDISCYLLALRILGGGFIRWSILSTACLSGFFRLWECRPPVLPDLSGQPLAAAVLGALFVGLGVGLIVRQGGSAGGDDALALSLSVLTGKRISLCSRFTDPTVVMLSLSYIPLRRIVYSLVTVTISSWRIDLILGGNKAASP